MEFISIPSPYRLAESHLLGSRKGGNESSNEFLVSGGEKRVVDRMNSRLLWERESTRNWHLLVPSNHERYVLITRSVRCNLCAQSQTVLMTKRAVFIARFSSAYQASKPAYSESSSPLVRCGGPFLLNEVGGNGNQRPIISKRRRQGQTRY